MRSRMSLTWLASIITRQWAKKFHVLYVGSSLSEPYTYIKDDE